MQNIIVALIPAFNPNNTLVRLARQLVAGEIHHVVVVDDGSRDTYSSFFNEIRNLDATTVLKHTVNMGKGAALKTGLNYIYNEFPNCDGVVTADADGQHLTEDILNVANALIPVNHTVVLGSRESDPSVKVPLRSRFGNEITAFLTRTFFRIRVSDTQTGLRCFDREFIPTLLTIPFNRYEFEMEMLLVAKNAGFEFNEVSVKKVYLDSNTSSHFNPLADSFRIYMVLFRYVIASLITAAIDYSVFIAAAGFVKNILFNTYLARGVALIVNYIMVRNVVFRSKKRALRTFPLYLSLVIFSGFVSASIIHFLMDQLGLSLIVAKLIAESTIYLANFAIQKEFIFKINEDAPVIKNTDWDSYYTKPYKTASFTRKITKAKLMRLLNAHKPVESSPVIAELGGGNSCFFDAIREAIAPSYYHIVDNNALSLSQFEQRIEEFSGVTLNKMDVLASNCSLRPRPDIVFSVGLIEHFSPVDTSKAIATHFELVKNNGIVLITFPTPTFLYRATRACAERLRLWIFHDERPLQMEEVLNIVKRHGHVLHQSITWPIFLTQGVIVAKKRPGAIQK